MAIMNDYTEFVTNHINALAKQMSDEGRDALERGAWKSVIADLKRNRRYTATNRMRLELIRSY